MFYVHYADRGPSGPCAQDVATTMPWDKLFIFSDREAAQPFLDAVIANKFRGRSLPRIVNTWDEEINDVVHKEV